MRHLSGQEIVNEIMNYIEESIYNYAILIDGEWGSGKTFFVKEKLIPAIEEKYQSESQSKVIYVSLYGIKNTGEISECIRSQILFNKFGNMAKGRPFIQLLTKGLAEKISVGTLEEAYTKIEESLAKCDNKIIIFDDLERCDEDANIILGYINNLVEQNQSKVIILANEKEIGNTKFHNNIEQKYIVSLNTNLKIPEEKDELFSNRSNQDKNSFTLDSLKSRTNEIFKENLSYFQIKEKVIGRTIFYKPNLKESIDSIVEKFSFKEEYVGICKETIIEILESHNYNNLRTVQFCLAYMNRIEKDFFIEAQDEHILIVLFKKILDGFLNMAIMYKKYGTKPDWDVDADSGTIHIGGSVLDPRNYVTTFRFANDYIFFSKYDRDYIKKVIDAYCVREQKKSERAEDPIKKLKEYFILSEDEVIQNVQELYDNLCEKKYDQYDYSEILAKAFMFKSIGIEPIPTNSFVNEIRKQVEDNPKDNLYWESRLISTNPYYQEYSEVLNTLISLCKENEEHNLTEIINTHFVNGTMQMLKEEVCIKREQEILRRKQFFSLVDLEICKKFVDAANSKGIFELRQIFNRVYSFTNISEYYYKDLELILLLQTYLENKEYDDKIKEANKKELCNVLSDVVSRLRKNDTTN